MQRRQPAPEYTQLVRRFGSPDLALPEVYPSLLGVDMQGFRAAGPPPPAASGESAGLERAVVAAYQLQDIADYKGALRQWFGRVAEGGLLAVVVPHAFLYERQNVLPSRWNPGQRRLYTPASLLAEVEEALAPDTYWVRHLSDQDGGYDYAARADRPPAGRHDVVLILEKIRAPERPPADPLPQTASLASGPQAEATGAPDLARRPAAGRIGRVLLLKLDHLGDFVMSLPALEKARAAFPDAHITLAVGSWNVTMAEGLGLFDRIVSFDAFPRNSTEEQADVRGTVSEFRRRFSEGYDLAIDLRSDGDTRVLLDATHARVKAALGSREQYPFLDIFLPIDHTRAGVEQAWARKLETYTFSEHSCWRNHFQIVGGTPTPSDDDHAIIWGPYRHLDPGRYRFEPFSDVERSEPGALLCDVALDGRRVAHRLCAGEPLAALDFVNTIPGARMEYRVFRVRGEAVPTFRFYGGLLRKAGSESVLHQSEYQSLLVELVAMRLKPDRPA